MVHAIRSLISHHGGPDMGGLARHPVLYDAVASRIAARLYRRVVADLGVIGLSHDALIVDVGTGPGRLPILIADAFRGIRVEGIDLSEEMITRARQLADAAQTDDASRVSFTVADVAELPHPTGSVDVVVSTASMHHWPDVAAGISDIARILRPGGQAVIYDPWASINSAVASAKEAGLTVRTQGIGFGIARLTLFSPA